MGAPMVNTTLCTPVFYILSDDMNSCYSCTFYYYPTIHYDTISLLQSRHMIMLFILASHLPSLIMDHPVVVFSLHTQFTHFIWLVFPFSMYSGSVLALFLLCSCHLCLCTWHIVIFIISPDPQLSLCKAALPGLSTSDPRRSTSIYTQN